MPRWRSGQMLRWILLPVLIPVRLLVYIWFKLTLSFLRGNVLFHSVPDRFTSTVQSGLLYRIINKQEMLWFHYLGFLSRMSRDSSIRWVVLSIPDLEDLEWSQIEEIRIRLNELVKSGKRLVGHAEKGGLKTLCLLSACERRFLAPGASFFTALPHSESFFFGSALKKLGIRVEVHTAGEFKSAGESVSRDSMTPSAKKNLEELLDARTQAILSGLTVLHSSDPNPDEKLHTKIRQNAFLEAEELYALKFCQGLVARANFKDLCEDLLPYWHAGEPLPSDSSINESDRLPILSLDDGIEVTDAPVSHSFPGVAERTMDEVIKEQLEQDESASNAAMQKSVPIESEASSASRSSGSIPGQRTGNKKTKERKKNKENTRTSEAKLPVFRFLEMDQAEKRYQRKRFQPFRIRRYPSVALVSCEGMIVWGDEQPDSGRIGALSMRKIFRDLEDSKNEAIFLYINSPGGLSDASEALYQDIYRLSRSRPVFAIIGPVAASGGYYMACAANRIYSPDLSLTGSVGVLRMRPELSGLYRKLGIHKQRVRFGPTTDLLSEAGNLSKKSQALLDESMDRAYNLFLDRVGRSRGLNRKETDLRGRGKVYTGSQFRSEGMVDRKGGFIEAFRDFRKEAGFGEQMFDIQIFPVLRPGAADLIRQGPFSAMRPLEKSELFQSKNLYMVHPDICFQHTGFQTELRRAGGSLIGSAILRL